MILLGTMYIIDEQNIEVLKSQLSAFPPPLGGPYVKDTLMCLNMDESSSDIDDMFPYHTQKATLLLPPPFAMQKYVDGDQEGFIHEYNFYLEYDIAVQEFIASILYYLHVGGNILVYIPQCLDDDSIWINTFQLFFFTRYGITMGTSIEHKFAFDIMYNNIIDDLLYSKNYIDIFDYVNNYTERMPGSLVWDKATRDLYTIGGFDVDPIQTYMMIKMSMQNYGVPILRPAVTFG